MRPVMPYVLGFVSIFRIAGRDPTEALDAPHTPLSARLTFNALNLPPPQCHFNHYTLPYSNYILEVTALFYTFSRLFLRCFGVENRTM